MLVDIDTGKAIDRIPYRRDFEMLRARLSDAEFDGMVERINQLIDEAGAEIATAGWLPGADWTGTPFEPIYTKAARGDFVRSALFFGSGRVVSRSSNRQPEQPHRSRGARDPCYTDLALHGVTYGESDGGC